MSSIDYTKTLEAYNLLITNFKITNPFVNICLTFALLNLNHILTFAETSYFNFTLFSKTIKISISSFILRNPNKLRTFEIPYFVDNSKNFLYDAFNWYLKINFENKDHGYYTILSMTKRIHPTLD